MAGRLNTGVGPISAVVGAVIALGCTGSGDGPSLSKSNGGAVEVPEVPADNPPIGAVANLVPIVERPAHDAPRLGYLHAGGRVPRAKEPYSTEGCPGGWYPVRPRGFVCAGEDATLDLDHPKLIARSIRPKDAPVPYTYARVKRTTKLFERDEKNSKAVVERGEIKHRSGLAVVGSWQALDPQGKEQKLGLMTNGLFVPVKHLDPAEPSDFRGVPLDAKHELPLGFVVKNSVRLWKLEKGKAERLRRLNKHEMLPLTGRFRTREGVRFWALKDGTWVRHQDVTVVRRRDEFPDFATDDQKWIDLSVITGTFVLYEGKKPVYATLASCGADRLSEEEGARVTKRGDFEVVGKHLTGVTLDPKQMAIYHQVYDAPWVLQLSSGQHVFGAYWHGRFGIEKGLGDVQLSPADAKQVFDWATPAVPSGWHGVEKVTEDEPKTLIRIRK